MIRFVEGNGQGVQADRSKTGVFELIDQTRVKWDRQLNFSIEIKRLGEEIGRLIDVLAFRVFLGQAAKNLRSVGVVLGGLIGQLIRTTQVASTQVQKGVFVVGILRVFLDFFNHELKSADGLLKLADFHVANTGVVSRFRSQCGFGELFEIFVPNVRCERELTLVLQVGRFAGQSIGGGRVLFLSEACRSSQNHQDKTKKSKQLARNV